MILGIGGITIYGTMRFFRQSNLGNSSVFLSPDIPSIIDISPVESSLLKISPLIENKKLKGEYGIGIIVTHGNALTVILKNFEVRTLKTKEGIVQEVYYKGEQVKVFIVSDAFNEKKFSSFPLSGALISGNEKIKNPSQRLIQLMEENGINKYRIIQE